MCSHFLRALNINSCFSNWWWKNCSKKRASNLLCTHADRIYSLDLPSSIWRVERAKAKMHRNGSQMITCRPFRIFKININSCFSNWWWIACSKKKRIKFALHPCWQDLQSISLKVSSWKVFPLFDFWVFFEAKPTTSEPNAIAKAAMDMLALLWQRAWEKQIISEKLWDDSWFSSTSEHALQMFFLKLWDGRLSNVETSSRHRVVLVSSFDRPRCRGCDCSPAPLWLESSSTRLQGQRWCARG